MSATYRQSDPDGAAQRVTDLTDAIADLRDATSSGWVGRQDDITGYLGELSGGRYRPADGGAEAAAITGLMDEYGADAVRRGRRRPDARATHRPRPIADVVSVRANQELAGVPVVDGELVFSLEVTDADTRVNAVRGRVFPALSPVTAPTVGAKAAAQTARAGLGRRTPRHARRWRSLPIWRRPARVGGADRRRDLRTRRPVNLERDLLRRRPDRRRHRRPRRVGRGRSRAAVVVPRPPARRACSRRPASARGRGRPGRRSRAPAGCMGEVTATGMEQDGADRADGHRPPRPTTPAPARAASRPTTSAAAPSQTCPAPW